MKVDIFLQMISINNRKYLRFWSKKLQFQPKILKSKNVIVDGLGNSIPYQSIMTFTEHPEMTLVFFKAFTYQYKKLKIDWDCKDRQVYITSYWI